MCFISTLQSWLMIEADRGHFYLSFSHERELQCNATILLGSFQEHPSFSKRYTGTVSEHILCHHMYVYELLVTKFRRFNSLCRLHFHTYPREAHHGTY